MALSVAYYDPDSSFYSASTISDRLKLVKRNPHPVQSISSACRRASHWTDALVRRLDLIDTLGKYDDQDGLIGHSGCVNALAWSQSGECLASGSDDQRIILWRMGKDEISPATRAEKLEQTSYPRLGLAQSDVIETGHSANIFSVKWAPNSGDKRLFTCAGDSEMRVFDLTRASSYIDRQTSSGKEYRLWGEGRGACMRVLRCHSSRAKRISTENSPDVFLSCAEDGEVRQTDLRVPHVCSQRYGYGEGCPRPLVQFQMELYSLSVSKLEPWLFAVAGTSDHVYLLDRRMVPRLLKKEWGANLDAESAALTHCVRRFGRRPFKESPTVSEAENARQRRKFVRAHVTAVKIAESNGRDMVASYSGDGLYTFDIKAMPGSERTETDTLSSTIKRRKMTHDDDTLNRQKENDEVIRRRKRIYLYLFVSNKLRVKPLRHEILSDLEALETLAGRSDHAENNQDDRPNTIGERATVALCQALMSVRKTHFTDRDIHDVALQEARAALLPFTNGLMGGTIMSLLDEIIRVYRDDTGELDSSRQALFDEARSLVRAQWFEHQTRLLQIGEQDEDERTIEGIDQASSSSNPENDRSPSRESEGHLFGDTDEPIGEDQVATSQLDSTDRRTSDSVEDNTNALSQHSPDSSMVDLQEDLEGEDDDSSQLFDQRMLMELFADENREEEVDFDDDEDVEWMEDDDDEDGDEDDEEEEEEDESDEEQDNRHDIPGGDAPIVYPHSRFDGHMNVETVKDCGFVGSNDEYVWSGSDCGHFFFWQNTPAQTLLGVWKGDDSVVNVLASHPTLPVCAVSGIDNSVKIFGPVHSDKDRQADRFAEREEIMRNNRKRKEGMPGLASRAFMRMIARHLQHSEGGGETIAVNRDDTECVVM